MNWHRSVARYRTPREQQDHEPPWAGQSNIEKSINLPYQQAYLSLGLRPKILGCLNGDEKLVHIQYSPNAFQAIEAVLRIDPISSVNVSVNSGIPAFRTY